VLIIPAIDLREGKCVRLRHGKAEEQTVYSDDPVSCAKKWVSMGARRLHVIDLDGAFEGSPKNLDWAVRIRKEANVEVQLGGGIRTVETAQQVLDAGIDRVILGTVVVEEAGLAKEMFDRFDGRIMVALDCKTGMVATRGWKGNSGFPVEDALNIVEKLGGREVIFTDIGRDGTLSGPNLAGVKSVMDKTSLTVYASGGVTTLDDLKALKAIGSPGCIVGKALYEGHIDLAEAIRTVG
jgi:phosphoribosylformimino-5-aminoimidazole carboxamide ribotide isomerase